MGIRIITDSTADLPAEILEKYKIEMIPLTVRFGEEEYRDYIDLSSKEFYDLLSKTEVLPTTSQIPPAVFIDAFQEEIEQGNSIIGIFISSKASGTYQSAVLASSEFEGADITVIDSTLLCNGTGMLVLEAAKMVQQGKSKEEIIQRIEEMKSDVRTWFVVDDLKSLQRGGRISGTQAFLGGILNLKPLLTVEEGLTKPIDKVRGRKKVLPKILELMKEEIIDNPDTIFIGHAVQKDIAEEFKSAIEDAFHPKEVIITEIGSVIGTHAGPGTLAVFYIKK